MTRPKKRKQAAKPARPSPDHNWCVNCQDWHPNQRLRARTFELWENN